ncbi:MAG: LamG-like jellyroll fold domain-containing protein, partial [Verrucomicrobiota bacterium]
MNDNTWHHVAVTCDGTNIRFYTDGVLYNTTGFGGGTMNRPLHIMAERQPNQFIPGLVDQTMVWNYARSLSEIQSDKTTLLTGVESGLIIYYTYENGTGSTVTDMAGGNHNGTLMNMENGDWIADGDPFFTNNTCPTQLSSTATVTVGGAYPTSAGTIATDQTGCNPFNAAEITSSTLPSGHTGTLEYKWQLSTTSSSSGFSDIPSSDASTYAPGVISVNTWFKRLARVNCKADWIGAVESNVVAITMNVSVPTVTVQGNTSTAANTSTANGTITQLCTNATNRGVIRYEYTGTDLVIGNAGVTNVNETGSFSATTFTAALTGLTANTRYNVRAHATNNFGTGYSARSDFWTLANVPAVPTVNNATTTTMDVAVNVNGNPVTTEFCINETGTSKYVQSDGTLGSSAVWQTASTWGTETVTGLSVDASYTFQVKARNSSSIETAYSGTATLKTLATVPTAPTVNNATATTMDVAVNENGNPATTEFCINETGTAKYVQADGTLDATAVWQSTTAWGTKTITGLSVNTSYTFKVKAKNGANVETVYSGTATLQTLSNVPLTPTVNNATTTTMDVAVNANGNPATTEFCINETGTTKYVQSGGTLGDAAVWQTAATWGTKTVTGLSVNTSYTFEVKARNGSSIETAYSGTATLKTLANVP